MNTSVKSLHRSVAVICEDHGKFLMVEENPKTIESSAVATTVINQPAGHVERNESLIQAASRETLEETGFDFNATHIVGIYQLTAENGKTYFRICFCGSVKKHPKPVEIDSDILAVHWMSVDEIFSHSHHRSSLVSKCLQDYLDHKRYPLDIIHSLD